MRKKLFSLKIFLCIISLCCLTTFASAESADELAKNDINLDKTKVVAQQVELSKNRLTQAKVQLANLQIQLDKHTATLSADNVNKQWLDWTKVDIDSAKSNLDGIEIELSESQQTLNLIQKNIQELDEQINAFNVFGLKIVRNASSDLNGLHAQLAYQKTLLVLEKTHLDYLQKLQKISVKILQLYDAEYLRIETLLKSRTMMQLKERQAQSEIDYQQQQGVWLQRLNKLYAGLAQIDRSKSINKLAYSKLENQIFYANENVNFMYLQMLIARYKDEIQQLEVSISRSTSRTLLNKVSDQVVDLSKQFSRVNGLLVTRIAILEKRKQFQEQGKSADSSYLASLASLEDQYKAVITNVDNLNKTLVRFRGSLDTAMKQELSARQGFLGFGTKTWLGLCSQILLVPSLTLQMVKNLGQLVMKSLDSADLLWWSVFVLFETIWLGIFYVLHRVLARVLLGIPDHALGHINLNWLTIKLLHRNLIDIAVLGNIFWFFIVCGIPFQNFNFMTYVGLVWLFFRAAITVARLCLVETAHDRAGHDVRLYYRLKWTLIVGGVVTALTVFLYQFPLLEVQSFFYRLFLLFLIIVSIFLLRARELFLGLILPHIDEHRTYLRRVVQLLAVLIPFVLLMNSVIGFFGFINFVLSVYWYEGIFLVVLAAYLLLRGLLGDVMEYFSHILIRHVTNGWLLTEAFLKPLDKILRIVLFLAAWVMLFFLYGWDRQSLVVSNLTRLMNHHLFDLLNVSITPVSILELLIIVSLLYWTARWTREFVYRFLLSRTKDLGVRNSIAILTQYSMILVGILIGLRVIGIDLRALTFVVSAFALGIGFGLRDLANNFACGFLLLFERPLRVGDTVSINGQEGDVMHIGGRAVTIRTWDHMELVVPNAEIFSKTFINWTAKDYIVRSVVKINVSRLDDPHMVQALIYKVLAGHKDVLSDPAPEVFLKEMADGLIEFEVRYYVNLRQVKSRICARSDVLMAVWDTFKQHGIQPPYPHHEVHVQS